MSEISGSFTVKGQSGPGFSASVSSRMARIEFIPQEAVFEVASLDPGDLPSPEQMEREILQRCDQEGLVPFAGPTMSLYQIKVKVMVHEVPTIEALTALGVSGEDARRIRIGVREGDRSGVQPLAFDAPVEPSGVDNRLLLDMLTLVTYPRDVTLREIIEWDETTKVEVLEWCGAEHLHASDNDDVEVPPIPDVLKV